jgi:glycosyltransferase involved in cell wall biosynthesis
MNNLIIITNNYPYGKGEEFFETEIKYTSQYFNEINLISLGDIRLHRRETPDNVYVHNLNIPYGYLSKLMSLRHIFRLDFLEELLMLRKFKIRLSFKLLKSVLTINHQSSKIFSVIDSIMTNNKFAKDTFLYSYWLTASAHAIVEYKKKNGYKIKTFSRVHEGDLYFESNPLSYLPYRFKIISGLDMVYPVSDHGMVYLQNKFKLYNLINFKVSRLGVFNYNFLNNSSDDNVFRVLTCSHIVPRKRLQLIIEALSRINEINVHWTHIGDGPQKELIVEFAEKKLMNKQNITYNFEGRLKNSEVSNYYFKNPVDLFINVSVSEGVPVSIMEAMSYSVPVIATDVGGNGEIVNNFNGLLISSNPSIIEIADSVCKFASMQSEDISSYRKCARSTFINYYNSDINYPNFYKELYNDLYK